LAQRCPSSCVPAWSGIAERKLAAYSTGFDQ
jgi:hypothetical protein